MILSEQLAAARQVLGKKIHDSKELAKTLQATPTAEAKQAFDRAAADAHAAGLEVQRIQGEINLEQLEALVDPPEQTLTQQFDRTIRSQELSGDAARAMPKLDFVRGERKLSDADYVERYGITREAHNAAHRRFLRMSAGVDRPQMYRELTAIVSKHMGKAPDEKWIHKLVDDSLGGFLSGDDFRAQIIRALPGYTTVRRSGARVINTAKSSVRFPVVNRAASNTKQYTSDLTQGASNWKQEALTTGGTARTPQSKPTFGQEEIPVHIWQPDPVEITQELMDDSDIDLDGLLVELFAETMGMDTDLAFLRGTGDGTPEGILNGGSSTVVVADASTYATPDASAAGGPDNGFQYKRIIDIFTGLAAQYRQNAVWYLNSDTFGRLLSITGSDGHPLFPVNAIPGTLLNRPMYFTEFLDTGATSGNVPIIFGDPRYYVIVERRAMGLMRLVERYAPNIALLPTARIGGQVVLPEAFRLGTTQA